MFLCSGLLHLFLVDFAIALLYVSLSWSSASEALPSFRPCMGGDNPSFSQKKIRFRIFHFFLSGAINKHPNCIQVKMKFEGVLISIMVTRDFFRTATTTLFALTRQVNGCDVDGNHGVRGRG